LIPAVMDIADLQELSRCLAATDIDELVVNWPGGSVRICRDISPDVSHIQSAHSAAAVDRFSAVGSDVAVTAPTAGIFLDRQPGDIAAMADAGQAVVEGDIVALIQVGAFLIPVKVSAAGKLGDCSVSPGSRVGYGDTLFPLEVAAT
jgi:biotin carboxyl carrier protein